MLDLEDNNFKILRMKEKLLDITTSNRDANLSDYREAAKNIDNMYFSELLDKIEKFNNESLSLEEELEYLNEVKEMYEQLEFIQHKFRNVYGKYTDRELELNDITRINQDLIINRINQISGYLINLKNIEKNKKELEELSNQLVLENKKKEVVENRILEYEDELKNNFLNAEGRKIVEGSIKYTSILQEFKDNNIDLEKMLEDKLLLVKIMDEVSLDRKDKDEMLKATELCYSSLPNKENKEVLDSVRMDAINAAYKLSLVKMAKLISDYTKDFDGARRKREDLIDLIKRRNYYVEKIGIKFSIDPFSRIRISSQLDKLDELGNNSKMITNLIKKIDNVNSKLEETLNKNEELLDGINEKIEIINDNLSISDVSIDGIMDTDIIIEKKVEDNQVISITLLPKEFKIDRAIEKTRGVINRVYQMINGYDKQDDKKNNESAAPQLIIEEDLDNEFDLSILDDIVLENEETMDSDNLNNGDENLELVDDNSKEIFVDLPLIEEDKSTTEKVEEVVNVDDSLFEDIVPFESVAFFSDRTDDEFEENNSVNMEEDNIFEDRELEEITVSEPEVLEISSSMEEEKEDEISFEPLPEDIVNLNEESKEIEMPELDDFWKVRESDSIEGESLDYQLSKLFSKETDDEVKTKKLAF